MSARLRYGLGVLFFWCTMLLCVCAMFTAYGAALLLFLGARWVFVPALHLLAVLGAGLAACWLLDMAVARAGDRR